LTQDKPKLTQAVKKRRRSAVFSQVGGRQNVTEAPLHSANYYKALNAREGTKKLTNL
jgi:hypothetical protein